MTSLLIRTGPPHLAIAFRFPKRRDFLKLR